MPGILFFDTIKIEDTSSKLYKKPFFQVSTVLTCTTILKKQSNANTALCSPAPKPKHKHINNTLFHTK